MIGPVEFYPIHVMSTLAPQGMTLVAEPQTEIKQPNEYLRVSSPSKPYEVREYSTLHWVVK
jgi:hypothetical protein